jgi:Nucleotidyl transferase AbiEii toxin, Type IV TA system
MKRAGPDGASPSSRVWQAASSRTCGSTSSLATTRSRRPSESSCPGVLDFAGLERHEVEVVDPKQHFAEKVHAFTRSYGDRPNTRVRDLPDMVLLIDDGLQPTPELFSIVSRLFEARAGSALPVELPDPPSFWRENYPVLATELEVSAKTLDEAMTLARNFWAALLRNKEE